VAHRLHRLATTAAPALLPSDEEGAMADSYEEFDGAEVFGARQMGAGLGRSGRWIRVGRNIVVVLPEALGAYSERETAAEESLLSELEAPPEPQWPTRTRFNPDAPSIPSGPFKTSPNMPCQQLRLDAAGLRDRLNSLNQSIALLERIKNVRPRDQALWDETASRLQKQLASLKVAMTGMLQGITTGVYKQDGCTLKQFAVVTEQVRKLELLGGWRRNRELCVLRNQLVFRLRQARGAFRLPGATGTPDRPVVCG
jgi:hypothetical protein